MARHRHIIILNCGTLTVIGAGFCASLTLAREIVAPTMKEFMMQEFLATTGLANYDLLVIQQSIANLNVKIYMLSTCAGIIAGVGFAAAYYFDVQAELAERSIKF
ncbi:MAG: hypothetical protein JSS50_01200 [Proteobacteria bacterium]|nr:hypothetical protein [Pseudomonadota bacterium]